MDEYGEYDLFELGMFVGACDERRRINKILSDPEWHEDSKSYTQTDTDLSHISEYCLACQLLEQINQEEEKNVI